MSSLLWKSKKTNGDEVIDALIGCELQEFLNLPECWDRIIEISYKIWEKEMPESYIKKLFGEYERSKEESKEDRLFQDSFAVISVNSLKNPLGSGSDTETDEIDERMNVILDTELQADEDERVAKQRTSDFQRSKKIRTISRTAM